MRFIGTNLRIFLIFAIVNDRNLITNGSKSKHMEHEGIPLKLVRLVKVWYHDVKFKVRVSNTAFTIH